VVEVPCIAVKSAEIVVSLLLNKTVLGQNCEMRF
jgi:hypothetical protein